MTTYHSSSRSSGLGVTVMGLMLIAAGVLLLLDNLNVLWIGHVWDLWPLSLVAVGVAELIQWRKQNQS